MEPYYHPRIELADFNTLFEQTKNPIVINELPYTSKEERQSFNKAIMTTFDSDIISSIPSCECGKLRYGFNRGKLCPDCKTPVIFNEEQIIDIVNWIRVPDGIDGFIMPVVWQQLTLLLNSTGFNLLEWLTDPKCDYTKAATKLTKNTLNRINYLESINWPRGLNNFIRYFDNFLELIIKFTKTNKQKGLEYVDYLSNVPKSVLFPKYLPIPTKAMLIIENTQLGSYAEIDKITGAIDACRTIADLSRVRHRPISHPQLESKIVTIINNLTGYYTLTIRNTFCPKKGWFRGLFRSKSHHCLRSVITSINTAHNWREIHIPWGPGVELLRWHILSKLLNKGYGYNESICLIEDSINVPNQLIESEINELISESDNIGIACVLQRNPSLDRLSAQYFFITRVEGETIRLGPLALKGMNADKHKFQIN